MFAQTTQTYHWSDWGSSSVFIQNTWKTWSSKHLPSVKWNDVLKLISVVSTLNLINSLHQQLFFVNAEGEVLKHTSHTRGDVKGEGFIFWITFSFSSQTDDTKYSFHWSRAGETEREQLESNICCNAGSLIKEKTFYSVWKNLSKQFKPMQRKWPRLGFVAVSF